MEKNGTVYTYYTFILFVCIVVEEIKIYN